jgi:hypothetical protein
MSDTPNKPTANRFSDHPLGYDVAEPSPTEIARRKSISFKCGHVKRDLRRKKRLTGKTLEFALTVVGEDSKVGEKLKAGRALTEYERHLVYFRLLDKRASAP